MIDGEKTAIEKKKKKSEGGYCLDGNSIQLDRCVLRQFRRTNYFPRQLLGVSEFQDEHDYLNGKRHHINKLIHGQGIICGLEVCGIQPTSENCYRGPEGEIKMISGGWEVCLSPGTALDCLGQEIVVSKKDEWWPVVGTKSPEYLKNKFGLYIRRKDEGKRPVLSPAVANPCEEVCCYSRIEENFEIFFDSLPDITQVTFDASSYSECDSATIVLVESKDDPVVKSQDSFRNVTLEYIDKSSDQSKHLDVEVSCKITLATVNLFSASVDLIKDIQVKPGSMLTCRYQLGERTWRAFAYVRSVTEEYPEYKIGSGQVGPYSKRDLYPKLKKKIAEDYYEFWLNECICCPDPHDPKVLLAVVGKNEKNELKIEDDLNTWYRYILFTNMMLGDLISNHELDRRNPHEVSANQIGALMRINGAGNRENQCNYIPEITLQEGTNIEINTVDDRTIRIGTKATSSTGLVTSFLDGNQLKIEGPFPHHIVGDHITPPTISLGEEAIDYLFEWETEVLSRDELHNLIHFLNSRVYTRSPLKEKGLKIKKSQGNEQNIMLTVTLQNGEEKIIQIERDKRDMTKATAVTKDVKGNTEITFHLIVCSTTITSNTEVHSKNLVYALKQPQTIMYMEDLCLFFLLDKFTGRPQDNAHLDVTRECLNKSDLVSKYLHINIDEKKKQKGIGNVEENDENDPFPFVFFKAINITPTDFCIFLVNYSINPRCITIRWGSNFAMKKEQ